MIFSLLAHTQTWYFNSFISLILILFQWCWRASLLSRLEVIKFNKELLTKPSLLLRFLNMLLWKIVDLWTPLSTKHNLHQADEALILLDYDSYRTSIGALQYLTMIRPVLAYSTNSCILHQLFIAKPSREFFLMLRGNSLWAANFSSRHVSSRWILWCWLSRMSRH